MVPSVSLHSRRARFDALLRGLCATPLGAISLLIVLAFFAVGLTADFIAHYCCMAVEDAQAAIEKLEKLGVLSPEFIDPHFPGKNIVMRKWMPEFCGRSPYLENER